MEPGTKIAVISNSSEGVAHVAPSEKRPEKATVPPLKRLKRTSSNLKLTLFLELRRLNNLLPHLLNILLLSPKAGARQVCVCIFFLWF